MDQAFLHRRAVPQARRPVAVSGIRGGTCLIQPYLYEAAIACDAVEPENVPFAYLVGSGEAREYTLEYSDSPIITNWRFLVGATAKWGLGDPSKHIPPCTPRHR